MASIANHAGGLPATSHVFLSEFFTWVLDGVARDDAAVKQLAVQQLDRDAELWGDHFGPGWLTHLLPLIRDGYATYPKLDATSEQSHEINQRFFVLAQRWLESHGGCAEDALAEVEHELARRQDRDPRHIALERLLYDRAAVGKLVVKARKWNDVKRRAASEYEPVPADFFLRPCRYFYSVFNGPSELVRWTDDGSPNWLLDSVFDRNDPPVSYVEAKITRKDALALMKEFAPCLSINERKRAAVETAIAELGLQHLGSLRQKDREVKITEQVQRAANLSVSARFVRNRFREARVRGA